MSFGEGGKYLVYVELSHRLNERTPLPPGVPPIEVRHHSSMQRGDPSNLFVLTFSNHTGTHVDAPWHFVADGLRPSDFDIGEFVFDHPFCLDLSLGDGETIQATHLQPQADRISRCDLLLLRTGYARIRQSDPDRYRLRSPGMSVDGAHFLARNFPRLRAVGLDTVSLACMQHLEEGMEAHRILLSGKGRRFLIIEDMNLEVNLTLLRRVIALPLFVEEVDASPCTVIGISDESESNSIKG